MAHTSQPHVVCAVRGRPESRTTVTRAIELALESDARLTFLMIIDLSFLAQATPAMSPLGAVYGRLEEMAQFMLLILCDRATRRGVKAADYIVRRGNVREELKNFALESDALVLVLGRPVGRPGSDVFSPEDFEAFVAEVEAESNLRVVKVDPEPDSSNPP